MPKPTINYAKSGLEAKLKSSKTVIFRRFGGVPGGPNLVDMDTLAILRMPSIMAMTLASGASGRPTGHWGFRLMVFVTSPQGTLRLLAARQMCTPRPLSPDVSPRDDNLGVWGGVFWRCFGGVLGGVPGVFWGRSGAVLVVFWGR